MEMQQMSYEDTMKALQEHAKANGDSFRVKITRRESAASLKSNFVALAVDVLYSHIVEAETWIGPLCGGGSYLLHVLDGKTGEPLAYITPSDIAGPQRIPSTDVTKSDTWRGPTIIIEKSGFPAAMGVGGGGSVQGPPLPPAGLPDAALAHVADDLKRRELALAEREHRAELAAIERRHAEDLKRLEARLGELAVARAQPIVPAESMLTQLQPLLMKFIEEQAQTRREQAKLEEERRAREEAFRREEAAARREDAKRPLIDPQVLALLDKAQANATEQGKHFNGLLEAQMTASRSMLQTVATIMEMNLNPKPADDGFDIGKAIREAAAGAMAFFASKAPAGAPGVTVPQLAGAPTNGTNGAQAPAPAAPAGVTTPPEPPINASPLLDMIEQRIRKTEPAPEVAKAIVEAFKDPHAVAEIQAYGSLIECFNDRLGDFGTPDHAAYLAQLFQELQTQAKAAGFQV